MKFIKANKDGKVKVVVYYLSEDLESYSVYEAYVDADSVETEQDLNFREDVIPSFFKKVNDEGYRPSAFLSRKEGEFPKGGFTKRRMWLFKRDDERAVKIIKEYRKRCIQIYEERMKNYYSKGDYCLKQALHIQKIVNDEPIYKEK